MGNNDGTLNGKVVFQAKKNHAVFESADKVTVHLKRKDIAGRYKSQPIITVQESSTGNQAAPPPVSSSKLNDEKRKTSVKKKTHIQEEIKINIFKVLVMNMKVSK